VSCAGQQRHSGTGQFGFTTFEPKKLNLEKAKFEQNLLQIHQLRTKMAKLVETLIQTLLLILNVQIQCVQLIIVI
jgi:hypothetical protein